MIVYKLTPQELQQITGQQMANGCYYNPIEDLNGNMVISQQEYDFCKLGEPIEYEPKETEEIE